MQLSCPTLGTSCASPRLLYGTVAPQSRLGKCHRSIIPGAGIRDILFRGLKPVMGCLVLPLYQLHFHISPGSLARCIRVSQSQWLPSGLGISKLHFCESQSGTRVGCPVHQVSLLISVWLFISLLTSLFPPMPHSCEGDKEAKRTILQFKTKLRDSFSGFFFNMLIDCPTDIFLLELFEGLLK